MYSKFNHGNQPYQIGNMGNLTDCNNNIVNANVLNLVKANGNCTGATNVACTSNSANGNNLAASMIVSNTNATSPNGSSTMASNANNTNILNTTDTVNASYGHIDEEEDDADSLNINFDDVNDHSDMEDTYYNNCATTPINSSNVCTEDISNKSDNVSVLYDLEQHFSSSFNSKLANIHHLNHLNQTNKQMAYLNACSPSSSSSCSTTNSSSVLESINEMDNSNEAYLNMPDASKSMNRNIHCIKEKIRRDRIKMSCNQLRRLIPNVNGFKTDMASLLETSVLWVQLIQANVPEQYLNNIKAKLASLASLKNINQIKSMQQQIQILPNNINVLNQKYKTNYEYLVAKSQHETSVQQQQHQQSQQHVQTQAIPIQPLQPQQSDQQQKQQLQQKQHQLMLQQQHQKHQQTLKQQQQQQIQQQTQQQQQPSQTQLLQAQQYQVMHEELACLSPSTPVNHPLNQATIISSMQQQLDLTSAMDICQQTLNNLQPTIQAPLNLKPNSWFTTYHHQLNTNDPANSANSAKKLLPNIAAQAQLNPFTDYTFYDKLIKKSPSNLNFNFNHR